MSLSGLGFLYITQNAFTLYKKDISLLYVILWDNYEADSYLFFGPLATSPHLLSHYVLGTH